MSLLRQEEALQFVESIPDERLRRVVRVFYRRVLRQFHRADRLPAGDFDLLYFVEGILRFCSQGPTLEAVFAGEDIRWFPEDDDRDRESGYCPLPERLLGKLTESTGWTWTARQHEAYWFGATLQDLALHQLVGIGTFAIARGPTEFRFRDEPPTSKRQPDAPMDILFCAEQIHDLCLLKQRFGRLGTTAHPNVLH